MVHLEEFFDLKKTLLAELVDNSVKAWQIMEAIPRMIADLVGESQCIDGHVMDGAFIEDGPIRIEADAVVEPGAYIRPPAYIGAGVVIRHSAYIRGNVVMLSGSLLGHSSEAKNSIFLEDSKAPHFAYVGDSVLGCGVNLGAGVKLANFSLKADPEALSSVSTIKIQTGNVEYDTGLLKMGAVLGDEVRVGCNSVLNPGTLIGQRALVYPMANVRSGVYPPDSVIRGHHSATV
jgi:NDP-sugar pyrophosphorylase family protein